MTPRISAPIGAAEFVELNAEERRRLSHTSLQRLIVRVDGAMLTDTFDARPTGT